jgi:glycosyltransferase involved in cell wall biosynthesis
MSADPRPRLLVVASTYPRDESDPAPRFVHELARRLASRWQVRVLCPGARGAPSRTWMDGVEIVRFRYAPNDWQRLGEAGGILPGLRRHPWAWLLLPSFLAGQLGALLLHALLWRPRIIHAHWLLPQGVLALLAARLCRVRLVATAHGSDVFALRGFPWSALRRLVLHRAEAVTAVGEPLAQRLRKEGPRASVEVLPMGTDLEGCFRPGERQRDPDRLLFVGRLVREKGADRLVEALPETLKRRRGIRLHLLGDGPDRAALGRRVTELGLDDAVVFEGAQPQSMVAEALRSAALLVLPGHADPDRPEGLGLVAIEALGCGCPVLSGPNPALAAALPSGAPVRFLAESDVASLAVTILDILEAPCARVDDGAWRKELLARFGWESMAARHLALFDRVLVGSTQ